MRFKIAGYVAALALIDGVTPAFASALAYNQTIYNTDLGIFALGMRDVGSGSIPVAGVAGRVTRAILFWHGPTDSTNPAFNANVQFAGRAVTGTNIGFSADNFWNSLNSQAYMADVTAYVSGNGSYALSGFAVKTNGASLWVFYDDGNPNNNRDIILFVGNDSNFSSSYDSAGWNIVLSGITYGSGTAFMRFYASDGQNFGSNDDGSLSVNGTVIATGGIFQGASPRTPDAGVTNGSLTDVLSFAITSFLRTGLNTLTVSLSTGINDAVSAIAVAADVPAGAAPLTSGLYFVPITPCRVVDTRVNAGAFGPPALVPQVRRDFVIPAGPCNIPTTAAAYSLNLTVVPRATLGFISIWPTGITQPTVSTLNSIDGRIKANAAIVPAGTDGSLSVLATEATELVLDINGYFVAPGVRQDALAFYPVTPCRLADTRNANGTLGGPALVRQQKRTFPIAQACGLPANAGAYSVNVTAVPQGPLGFVTFWPTGAAQPLASTLNALTGTVTANAAITPAGTSGAVDIYATDAMHLVLDVNGYFAAPGGPGAMKFYSLYPCRSLDTRVTGGPLVPSLSRDHLVSCNVPLAAGAYSFNATVVPPAPFGYLTLWPLGTSQPVVSTLNAVDGSITSNAAIVPSGIGGTMRLFGSDAVHLILDLNGFFAP
jgi:hypothetical protein